jgi:hypothetical protein
MTVEIIMILALVVAVAGGAIGPSLMPERRAPVTEFDRMIADFGQRRRAESAAGEAPVDRGPREVYPPARPRRPDALRGRPS